MLLGQRDAKLMEISPVMEMGYDQKVINIELTTPILRTLFNALHFTFLPPQSNCATIALESSILTSCTSKAVPASVLFSNSTDIISTLSNGDTLVVRIRTLRADFTGKIFLKLRLKGCGVIGPGVLGYILCRLDSTVP